MLLVIGIDAELRPFGEGRVRECPRCHNATRWLRVRSFHQFTVFPAVRSRRHRYESYALCGAVVDA